MLVETAGRVFAAQDRYPADASGDEASIRAQHWSVLQDSGIALALHPSMEGLLGLESVCDLLKPAAYHGSIMPLAETFLAQWLLSATGAHVPTTPLAVALADEPLTAIDGRLTARLPRVPELRNCSHVVIPLTAPDFSIALVPINNGVVQPGRNLADDSRDGLLLDSLAVVPLAAAGIEFDQIKLVGAAFRCAQIAGALDRVLALTLQYVQDRVQFGKPLAKMQAVQQLCAVLAGHCAAASAAADLASDGLKGPINAYRIAAAKSRCSETAGAAAAITHQLHGAMGITREHRLHFFTRRLWSWRDEFGNESCWNAWLGGDLAARGPDALWAKITEAA